MSAPYEYFNLPEEDEYQFLKPVPEEFLTPALSLVKKALVDEDGIGVIAEVKAAHLFDRKGYLTPEAFGQVKINTSYRGDDDDILLQVTLRMRHPEKSSKTYEEVHALDDGIREFNKAQARAALNAEIAAEEARAAAAAESIAKKRAELEAL